MAQWTSTPGAPQTNKVQTSKVYLPCTPDQNYPRAWLWNRAWSKTRSAMEVSAWFWDHVGVKRSRVTSILTMQSKALLWPSVWWLNINTCLQTSSWALYARWAPNGWRRHRALRLEGMQRRYHRGCLHHRRLHHRRRYSQWTKTAMWVNSEKTWRNLCRAFFNPVNLRQGSGRCVSSFSWPLCGTRLLRPVTWYLLKTWRCGKDGAKIQMRIWLTPFTSWCTRWNYLFFRHSSTICKECQAESHQPFRDWLDGAALCLGTTPWKTRRVGRKGCTAVVSFGKCRNQWLSSGTSRDLSSEERERHQLGRQNAR